MDIKLRCVNQFRLIELTEQNHFVKDRPLPLSIYNALMVSQKGNPLLWQAIQKIVLNVKNKYIGRSICILLYKRVKKFGGTTKLL